MSTMKITSIRDTDGKPFKPHVLKKLSQVLQLECVRKGFLTHLEAVSQSGLSVGIGEHVFRVDTERLGYNAQIGFYDGNGLVVQQATNEGYMKTSQPTWAQRVEFYRLVNRVLDENKVSCDVRVDGTFTVRTKERGAVRDWQWDYASSGVMVVSLSEAERKMAEIKISESELDQKRRPRDQRIVYHVVGRPDDVEALHSQPPRSAH